MIDQFFHQHELLAIVIRHQYQAEGIEFFTPENFSQQLAYMKRPRNHQIAPHQHLPVRREVTMTQEVLYLKSGLVRVDLYDKQQCYLESLLLHPGDVILLASGGHGFLMLQDSELIEVKQGPYAKEQDKVRFAAVSAEQVVLR